MVGGILLMLTAPFVVSVLPAGAISQWTDADQAALQKASSEFHAANNSLAAKNLDVSRSRGMETFDPVAPRSRHVAAREELEKQQARLLAAQSRPTWLLWIIRLAGVAAATIGVCQYFRVPLMPPQAAPATTSKSTATLPPKLEALKRRLGR